MKKIEIKINYLIDEIKKIKGIENHQIYFQKKEAWISPIDITNNPTEDQSIALNKKIKTGFLKIETEKDFCTAIFWIENNKIAIVAKLKRGIHQKTLKRILADIKICIDHAKQNFHANHDTLTGLLNRNGTQTALIKNSSDFLDNENEIDEGEQKIKTLESIAILSFDIDNFKQINDTHGHQIGDMALSIFSQRLERSIKKIEKNIESKLILSRPGGEEFELIILKNVTRNILDIISTEIFNELRNPTVSIEDEIKRYQDFHSISVPQNIYEVKILASVGIASKTLSATNTSIHDVVAELRQSADTALYRAKNDGKDCARFFDDIRLKHGRIIEFHSQAELAIVDIGKSVNVKNGDIYSVYYPPFTGENSFIRDDGRSRKKLGDYIAVESAKIQVIHVQDQLSTCVVIEKHTANPIPIGSLLKSLTVGTKPRFFPSRQFQTDNSKAEDLIKNITFLLKDDSLLAIINLIPIIDTDDFEEKSRLLLKYRSYISMTLPERTEIFLSADESMFLLIKSNSYYIAEDEDEIEDDENFYEKDENFILQIKDKINENLAILSKHFNFRAGIYLRCDHPEFTDVSPEICLHLSKAALHITSITTKKLKISYFEANRTILAWRRENNTQDALADYCSFKKYGITDYGMENQIGLSILGSEDIENIELAESALTIANNSNLEHDYFWANLGLVKSYMGKFSEAYELLIKIKDSASGKKYPATYRIALAKSALEKQKIDASITDEKLLELINWIDENYTARSTSLNYNKLYLELEQQKEKLKHKKIF